MGKGRRGEIKHTKNTLNAQDFHVRLGIFDFLLLIDYNCGNLYFLDGELVGFV